ncbi:MAG: hypothetical protein KH828_01685 [Clostridiales bacterium]|nr:hypothetical protein [Clostridiales bacterium]
MTAKEYLSELQTMKVKIEQLREQRQMYLEMATSITAPINPVRVQTSGIVDQVGNNTSKAADLAVQIDEEVAVLLEKQNEIIHQIRELHNIKYVQLLFKVYVQLKTIKQAATEIGHAYYYTVELHKKALAAFEEKYADILAI